MLFSVAGDPRAERMASDESAFRAINERAEEISSRLAELPRFVCECADLSCTERSRVEDERPKPELRQRWRFAPQRVVGWAVCDGRRSARALFCSHGSS
jgi:hypothetical protein